MNERKAFSKIFTSLIFMYLFANFISSRVFICKFYFIQSIEMN